MGITKTGTIFLKRVLVPKIEKEKILRLNCPGYGEESYLTKVHAKPLSEYDAIIVNPTSIMHLFDRDHDLRRQIEDAQTEGLSSLTVPNDTALQLTMEEMVDRAEQLIAFLEQGGCLIYLLCRPFLVRGTDIFIDNYDWLFTLTPDKDSDNTKRSINSNSFGTRVELTAEGLASAFVEYLTLPGLEWTSYVRTENLSEVYTPLATAGPKKNISGYVKVGEQGAGSIVFLPAPWSPDNDRALVKCLNIWRGVTEEEMEPKKVEVAAVEKVDYSEFLLKDD